MPTKKYHVSLTETQREELTRWSKSQRHSERERKRARILLLADEGSFNKAQEGGAKTDVEIAALVKVCLPTVNRARPRFVLRGLEPSLYHKEQQKRKERLLDGDGEAHLVALVCSAPPDGHTHWGLHLIKDTLIEQRVVDTISHETVRQTLKKKELKPWLKKCWCIPPKQNAAFVCQMEDVLFVYLRPQNEKRPLICLDEASKQLLSDARPSLPLAVGQPVRQDSEYVRNGTASLFMVSAPLLGWRHVEVTDQRTCQDFARVIKTLVDVQFPDADKIVLVMDNLNTHGAESLYKAFEPAEALRLKNKLEIHFKNKLEIHYTPQHGSWLNMADTE